MRPWLGLAGAVVCLALASGCRFNDLGLCKLRDRGTPELAADATPPDLGRDGGDLGQPDLGDADAGVDSAPTVSVPPVKVTADGWERRSPLLDSATAVLYGIWGSSASNVWAVGTGGQYLHYDGQRWRRVVRPAAAVESALAAHGTSATDVWIAGGGGRVLHYNGTSVSETLVSGYSGWIKALWAAAPDEVWGVGATGTILRYNGAWSVEKAGSGQLNGIWGAARDDIWAVGTAGTIVHYDGVQWWLLAEPPTPSTLNAVWGGSSSAVWAVGNASAVVHYDGSRWRELSPALTVNTSLYATWGVDASDFWVGGIELLAHFDGQGWNTVELEPGTAIDVHALWGASASDIWASAEGARLYHYDGSGWTRVHVNLPGYLYAVHGAERWIAGDGGKPLRAHRGGWAAETPPTVAALYTIWRAAEDDVWAAGASAHVIHRDGDGWQVVVPPASEELNGSRKIGDLLWFVGDNGTVAFRQGSAWGHSDVPSGANLLGVWGEAPHAPWVVGAGGALLQRQGTAWEATLLSTGATLYGIWGVGQRFWVVGTGGTIVDCQSGSCTPTASVVSNDTLIDVWGRSTSDVYAVGVLGTIAHYDGTIWLPQQSGTAATLRGVWGDADGIFAVGSSGNVLEKR